MPSVAMPPAPPAPPAAAEREPSRPAILLRFAEGVDLVERGADTGRLVVRTALREVDLALADPGPGIAAAFQRLAGGGATEEDLAALVLDAGGPTALPVLYYQLAELAQRCLLAYQAVGERGPLATASFASPFLPFRRRRADDRQLVVFSRFACIRRDGGRMLVESPLSAVKVALDDPRVGALCLELATPRRPRELPASAGGLAPAEREVACALLLSCRLLAEVDGAERASEEEDGPLAYWELADLLLHGRSRLGRRRPGSAEGFGGTHRFAGRFAPPPLSKPAMSDESVELVRPDLDRLAREDLSLTAALEGRRSRRGFGEPPVTLRQLGEFLYRTARQRGAFASETGQELGSRPYPGGGAIYELEIYLSVSACGGLAPGLYHYAPREHRLWKLASPPEAVAELLRDAADYALLPAAPQVLLTIAARFARVFWKYEGTGYALILKNVGVLYQTMYLVAEAMGLGACALGVGNADLFAVAAGVDYHAESSVGELILGSRP